MKNPHSIVDAIEYLHDTIDLSRRGQLHHLHAIREPYAAVLSTSSSPSKSMVATTMDGVGTKAALASQFGRFNTLGIDCVAMNVNDLLCVGAEPVAMLDYMALGSLSANMISDLVDGLVKGAKIAQISIPGGETAIVPRVLKEGNVRCDLVGTGIGYVDEHNILVGQDIEAGDEIVGFASSGIHANGIGKAMDIFEQHGIALDNTSAYSVLDRCVGLELLEPSTIYVGLARSLRSELDGVRAFFHITGGGLKQNLPRVPPWVKEKVGFSIGGLVEPPPIFGIIQELGDLSHDVMYSTFNMGVGFCAIVPPSQLRRAISISEGWHGIKAWHIGRGHREVPR